MPPDLHGAVTVLARDKLYFPAGIRVFNPEQFRGQAATKRFVNPAAIFSAKRVWHRRFSFVDHILNGDMRHRFFLQSPFFRLV